ncbi:MAG: hypothetical protein HEP80_18815 [Dolichospermum sp. UKL201]|nr:MAG: hypothetical protein HEP80_18815 [Dolichospermum sp. UKL201]
MQTNKNDSAFPIFDGSGEHFIKHRGLSKREYFAALALQGILSNPFLNPDEYNPNLNACLAIEAADTLIHRLNKTDTWEGCH